MALIDFILEKIMTSQIWSMEDLDLTQEFDWLLSFKNNKKDLLNFIKDCLSIYNKLKERQSKGESIIIKLEK